MSGDTPARKRFRLQDGSSREMNEDGKPKAKESCIDPESVAFETLIHQLGLPKKQQNCINHYNDPEECGHALALVKSSGTPVHNVVAIENAANLVQNAMARMDALLEEENAQFERESELLRKKGLSLQQTKADVDALKTFCAKVTAIRTAEAKNFSDHDEDTVAVCCSKVDWKNTSLPFMARTLSLSSIEDLEEPDDEKEKKEFKGVLLHVLKLAHEGGLAKNPQWLEHMEQLARRGYFHDVSPENGRISLDRVFYRRKMSLLSAKVYFALILNLDGCLECPSDNHRLQIKKNELDGGNPWCLNPVEQAPDTPASNASARQQGAASPLDFSSARSLDFNVGPPQGNQQPSPMGVHQQSDIPRSVSPGQTTPVVPQGIFHPGSGFGGRNNRSVGRPPRSGSSRRSHGRPTRPSPSSSHSQGRQAAQSPSHSQGRQAAPSPSELTNMEL